MLLHNQEENLLPCGTNADVVSTDNNRTVAKLTNFISSLRTVVVIDVVVVTSLSTSFLVIAWVLFL